MQCTPLRSALALVPLAPVRAQPVSSCSRSRPHQALICRSAPPPTPRTALAPRQRQQQLLQLPHRCPSSHHGLQLRRRQHGAGGARAARRVPPPQAVMPTGSAFTALQQQVVGAESVLSAVGVLAAIVAIHELGHFLAARLQNIHVSKFSVGFGPKLLSWEDKVFHLLCSKVHGMPLWC